MGILDAPAPQTTAEHLAQITTRLQMSVSNVVLQVLGDSTGVTVVGTQLRWPYLVGQWLAQQYPAYTVNYRQYNDTTKAYDALGSGNSYVLQTGTGTGNAGGPFVLDIYNGSVSGTNVAYSITNFATQVPVAPHAVIINHCHNDGGNTAYRAPLFSLTRLIQDSFPGAGIVLTAQNPEAATYQYASQHLTRNQQVMDLAASEGYGLINVTQAFLNTPNWTTALLLPDGIHPNDSAGSPLWANLIKQHLRRSVYVVPRTYTPRITRVFLPASSFIASEGAPTLGVYGVDATKQFPAWAFDKDIQQGVIGHAEYPHTWQTITIYAVWNVANGAGHTGSDGCKWELGLASAAANAVFQGPQSVGSATAQAENALASLVSTGFPLNSTAWETVTTRFPFVPTYKGRPVVVRVRRLAADAGDTLAETAYLQGLVIERAS